MELKEYRLGDVAKVTRGASLAGKYYASEGKYIRLTLGNFNYKEGGFKEDTQKDNLYYIGDIDSRFILHKGDILTPLTEQAIGLLGATIRIPEDDKYIQSQDTALITCNKDLLDRDYCYYLFSTDLMRCQISGPAQQTKIRHTSPDKIEACKVFLPSLPTQRKIAGLLSALDAKISLCREMNTHLESLARQIYQYWFLQFQYPNATQQLTYNPILKKNIPIGWEYITADKLTNVATGKEDANFSTPNGQYPFFTCSKENLYCDKAAFSGKAILIAGNGDFNVKHYTGEFNAYQRTYVLIPRDPKYYGVLYFAAKDKIASFKAKSNGSIIKFITKGDIESIGIYECNHPGVYEQINTLLDRIEHNDKEITALTHQRDELLPLLMNGQVVLD